MKLALGRLGWTEEVFYKSTLRAFLLAIEAKDAADTYKENWWSWVIRNHAFIVGVGLDPKKAKSADQLWDHPWDEISEKQPDLSQEAIERMHEVFRKWDEQEVKENGGNSGH